MQSYVRFVVRYRFPVLGICLGLCVLAVWFVSRAELSTNLGEQFLGDRPEYLRYRDLTSEFGTDEIVIIGLEGVDPLDPAWKKRLETAVQAVRDLPDVGRIQSILDSTSLQSDTESVRIDRYVDLAQRDPVRKEEIRRQMIEDPYARGIFVSEDGRSLALTVVLKQDLSRAAERYPEIVEQVVEAFVQAGFDPEGIRRGGFVPVFSESMRQLDFNVLTVFPLVALVLLVMVWVLFGRFWPAVLTLAVSLLAVLWTGGFLLLCYQRVHLFFSLLPPVIIIVAFSDVVHLCSAYLAELRTGKEKESAIRAVGGEVGKACILTSLTTFVGFVSMALVPDPSSQLLGLGLAFGVSVALVLAVTLVPIAFSFFPAPKIAVGRTEASAQSLLEGLLRRCNGLAVRRPRTLVAAFVGLLVISLVGANMVRMDFVLSQRFSEDNEISVDDRWFRENFGSVNQMDVFVHSGEADGLFDPENLSRIAAFQEALTAHPDVESSLSVVDLLTSLHRHLVPDAASRRSLPETRQQIAQLLLFIESFDAEGLEQLMTWDRSSARIQLRVRPGGALALAAVGDHASLAGSVLLEDALQSEPTGLVYLLGHFFNEVFAAQLRGLLLTFLAITIMMMIGLRSVRAGALSMLPNLLPLAVLLGVVGITLDPADTDILIISIMAIGIGVDDTIHFLMRYRVELGRGRTVPEAVEASFDFAGRAIMMTTLILVFGFIPCAFSGFMTMKLLGQLLPVTLLTALAADLLLVPAMIHLGWLKPRPARHVR